MRKSSADILKKIEDISQSWELRPNGNYYNAVISATIHIQDGEWKFVHDGKHKTGGATSKDTIPLCFTDYLISGADSANDLLEELSQTNLPVQKIKEVTGLCDSDIKTFILNPQNENNAVLRAGLIPENISQQKTSSTDDLIDWDKVLKESLREKPSFKKDRPLENKHFDIHDSWITAEVLSPNTYKKPEDLGSAHQVSSLTGVRLPWEKSQSTPNDMELFYQVYLGSVDVKIASNNLLQLYKDDSEEKVSSNGYAAIAVITVDKKGRPLELALSSFLWAYGRALNNKLEHLRCWSSAENILKMRLEDILFETDNSGQECSLTREKIEYAYRFLVRNCNVPEEDCLKPTFAIKQYKKKAKKGKEQETPGTPLLNSFYLEDIQYVQKAFKNKDVGTAIRQYLGDIPSPGQKDLLKDKELLGSTLRPENTPLGRWPGKGRYPLVLLQQTAVNLATKAFEDGGLFSVNGPPGTGKTTLLRDIVASVIVKRAKFLSAFKNPKEAFTKKGKGYELDESLKGHEILVASSNNNAVENISKELPQLSQISEELSEELAYFKTISDALADEKYETWGLCAVALGNSKNRYTFSNKFWWENDTSLRSYLKAVNGEEVPPAVIKDKESGRKIQRVPLVVQQEYIPRDPVEISENWANAVQDFNDALAQADLLSKNRQELLEALEKIEEKKPELLELVSSRKELVSCIETINEGQESIELDIKHEQCQTESLKQQLDLSDRQLVSLSRQFKFLGKQKKSLFERVVYRLNVFFKLDAKNPLQEIHDTKDLVQEKYYNSVLILTKKQRKIIVLQDLLHAKMKEKNELEKEIACVEDAIMDLQGQIAREENSIHHFSEICENCLITKDFWNRSQEEQQLFSPNFTDEEQRLRDDVFVAAIKLHKAFIEGAAKPLGYNLHGMMKILAGESPGPLVEDMWASLFLVIPVVSTTFASVRSMLRGLGRESLGWLLIDEAGQGTPQAAVGAIYRSKNVISVGDPLQIPPVTTLPKSLLDTLATHHGVNPQDFNAPQVSIQTLSDRANSYGTTLKRNFEDVRIGAPLLVHRRCENPMFHLSNALAYNNLMVYATTEKPSSIKENWGESHWIHIEGRAEEKWCPEEGEEVFNRLKNLIQNGGYMPDLFIISPFKVVAQRMRSLLISHKKFFERRGISIYEWAKDHVGTVHTFQGKEAEAVIFLLGAPDVNQDGARNWATSQVNILNVAISRAKCAFYIIGNQNLWRESGYMELFSQYISLSEKSSVHNKN
tara:strand:- start:128 stop:3874 length:3747 start_codon:yes stop_codon:yes gene_type:complete